MLRLLNWSSGLGADKAMDSLDSHMVAARQHPTTNMERVLGNGVKRKRADSDSMQETASPNKRRAERFTHVLVPKQDVSAGSSRVSPLKEPPQAPASSTESPSVASHTPATESEDLSINSAELNSVATSQKSRRMDSLRQTIQSQISLEILLKHDELRLIDQELAKCQVALEQLRRCTEIPYPATKLSQSVSNGTGPALQSSATEPPAQSPAPWGVTDGPYARHYAKWLIPDPQFDGGVVMDQPMNSASAGKTPTKARSTRGSFPDERSTGSISSVRQRGGGKLKALSSGYPQPKEKAGLVIQKRKSDGAMIKLVCLDCRRDHFNSAQGFINHCRIAHNRSFASHDVAADACGEPVEVDESGAVVGQDVPSSSAAGMIHPLIRSAHSFKPKLDSPLTTTPKTAFATPSSTGTPTPHLRGGNGSPHPNYKASPLTPMLSAFVKRQGLGLNLDDLVSDAKTKVILDDSSDDEEMVDVDETPGEQLMRGRHPQVAGSKQPARSAISPLPAASKASVKRADTQPLSLEVGRSVPTLGVRGGLSSPTALDFEQDELDNLEISPINDSNQAPSLIDDDEEYEAHSSSLSSSESEEQDEAEPDFDIADEETGGPSRRESGAGPEVDCSGNPISRVLPSSRGRPSAIRRSIGDREEKHVSFVSPSPARDLHEQGKGRQNRKKA